MKRTTLVLAFLATLGAGVLLAQSRYFLGTGDFRTTEIGADGKTFLEIAPAGTITARNSATLVGFAVSGGSQANPVLDLPQINDTDDAQQYVFAVSNLVADRTVTLPLLTGNDEFVFKDHAVTLTNKTLTSPVLNGTLSGTGLVNTPLTTPTLTTPLFSGSPTGYGVTQWAQVDITEANIIAMNGAPVTVVAGATDEIVEFCGAVLIFDFAGAAYDGGGDVWLQSGSAGAILSNSVTAANSFGSAGDKIFALNPLNAAGGYAIGHNSGITITNGTAGFTDPGSAAGVGRLKICFRRWQSGL